MTAGGVEPWNPNPIALFDKGDALSNGRNQTDGFVAGNETVALALAANLRRPRGDRCGKPRMPPS